MVALLLIAVMAFFDTLSVSGYFFYGTGVIAAVSVALFGGHSEQYIFLAVIMGALMGDTVNYTTGRLLEHQPKVQERMKKAKTNKLLSSVLYKQGDPFWRKIVLATVFRFVAVTRPVNAVMLGTVSKQTSTDWLALFTAAILWTAAWLSVVVGVVGVVTD